VYLKNNDDCRQSHNSSIDTTNTPNPLSFYNNFKLGLLFLKEEGASKQRTLLLLQAQRRKEAFLASVTLFLHRKDMFLYYKEDNMPDMAKIENSLLRYQVSQSFLKRCKNLHLIFACLLLCPVSSAEFTKYA
jgi:hypothetical protein